MSDKTYTVNEIVGTSIKSWEDAAERAIETARHSLQDLRIGEVVKQDVTVQNGQLTYRIRLNFSTSRTKRASELSAKEK
jgi:dodecin